jgi:hypothetical protein
MLHQKFSNREDLEDLLLIQWKYLSAGIEVMTA